MRNKPAKEKKPKKPFSMTDFLLVWTFVAVNIFIAVCLVAFFATRLEPVTLIVAVFAFFGFECGAMAVIRKAKIKKGETDENKPTDDNKKEEEGIQE